VGGPATLPAVTSMVSGEPNYDFDLNIDKNEHVAATSEAFFIGNRALPPLPQKLSPSQAARLAEIIEFFHSGLVQATENIEAKDDGTQVTLGFTDWQRILSLEMILARYLRAVAEPDALGE
jgi:hypothetical protein